MHAPVAGWPWAGVVLALVDLGVGVAQLDGDVPLQLIFEAHRLIAGRAGGKGACQRVSVVGREQPSLPNRRRRAPSPRQPPGCAPGRQRWLSRLCSCRVPRGRSCLAGAGGQQGGRVSVIRCHSLPPSRTATHTPQLGLFVRAQAVQGERRKQGPGRPARGQEHSLGALRMATHWATHAPMFIVACREMTSGDSGVSLVTSSDAKSWTASAPVAAAMAPPAHATRPPRFPGDYASTTGTWSPGRACGMARGGSFLCCRAPAWH